MLHFKTKTYLLAMFIAYGTLDNLHSYITHTNGTCMSAWGCDEFMIPKVVVCLAPFVSYTGHE